jgi:hypothetical protein
MRRLAGISALVLIFLSTSLWAQRRVGSAGIRSGFAPRGGVSFHAPVPHAGITIRTFRGPFTRFHRGFVYRPYWRYGYPGYYGYYGYAGYYDPFLWGSASSYSYDNSSNYNAYYDQSQQLQQQVNNLENEVERLREERYAQPVAPRSPAVPAAPATPAKPESASLTVLIFKDQHREEVKNYAVVGQTVWIFSEQRARKIPLDQLDIPATQQANDERGLDFAVPAA